MRKIVGIVGVLLLIAAAAGLAVLIPAHWQVRSVGPELPSRSELLSLRTDRGPVGVRFVTTSQQPLARGQISHNSVVIEWANGDLFVVDVGMDSAGATEFGELMQTISGALGPAVIHGTLAELLGDDVARVQGVGFTHLHIDHSQGISDFCAARGPGAVGLQTTSQKQLQNLHTSEGAELVSTSCLEMIELPGDGLVSHDRFPGVAAFQLGGHTPGSTLWAVALANRVLLFSGDITNNKASIDQDLPKPWIYSYLLVPEDTERTARLREWLRELDQLGAFSVVVSHDLDNHAAALGG